MTDPAATQEFAGPEELAGPPAPPAQPKQQPQTASQRNYANIQRGTQSINQQDHMAAARAGGTYLQQDQQMMQAAMEAQTDNPTIGRMSGEKAGIGESQISVDLVQKHLYPKLMQMFDPNRRSNAEKLDALHDLIAKRKIDTQLFSPKTLDYMMKLGNYDDANAMVNVMNAVTMREQSRRSDAMKEAASLLGMQKEVWDQARMQAFEMSKYDPNQAIQYLGKAGKNLLKTIGGPVPLYFQNSWGVNATGLMFAGEMAARRRADSGAAAQDVANMGKMIERSLPGVKRAKSMSGNLLSKVYTGNGMSSYEDMIADLKDNLNQPWGWAEQQKAAALAGTPNTAYLSPDDASLGHLVNRMFGPNSRQGQLMLELVSSPNRTQTLDVLMQQGLDPATVHATIVAGSKFIQTAYMNGELDFKEAHRALISLQGLASQDILTDYYSLWGAINGQAAMAQLPSLALGDMARRSLYPMDYDSLNDAHFYGTALKNVTPDLAKAINSTPNGKYGIDAMHVMSKLQQLGAYLAAFGQAPFSLISLGLTPGDSKDSDAIADGAYPEVEE